ncbi:MAG: dihydrodipicolinate synthase family protein, partial [Alphaproteobacteria bacterium]
LVEYQITEGVKGLIPLGSTGEFLSVSREERQGIVETVIRAARGRVPVLIGTGAEDTREVVALSREAEAQGADGVMIIPPFYSVPTEDELFHHYKTVADAIGIPIMVYNNPATSNVDMLPATLARISTIPNCRYVKESTLEVTRVRDIVALCGDRMEVFAGVLGYESAWLGAIAGVATSTAMAARIPYRSIIFLPVEKLIPRRALRRRSAQCLAIPAPKPAHPARARAGAAGAAGPYPCPSA